MILDGLLRQAFANGALVIKLLKMSCLRSPGTLAQGQVLLLTSKHYLTCFYLKYFSKFEPNRKLLKEGDQVQNDESFDRNLQRCRFDAVFRDSSAKKKSLSVFCTSGSTHKMFFCWIVVLD